MMREFESNKFHKAWVSSFLTIVIFEQVFDHLKGAIINFN